MIIESKPEWCVHRFVVYNNFKYLYIIMYGTENWCKLIWTKANCYFRLFFVNISYFILLCYHPLCNYFTMKIVRGRHGGIIKIISELPKKERGRCKHTWLISSTEWNNVIWSKLLKSTILYTILHSTNTIISHPPTEAFDIYMNCCERHKNRINSSHFIFIFTGVTIQFYSLHKFCVKTSKPPKSPFHTRTKSCLQ